ncbi:TPA: hypothetical protein ACXIJH_005259, partial [Serratia marcescens]
HLMQDHSPVRAGDELNVSFRSTERQTPNTVAVTPNYLQERPDYYAWPISLQFLISNVISAFLNIN